MTLNWPLLIPVLLYLAGVYLLALYCGRAAQRSGDFLSANTLSAAAAWAASSWR